MKEASLPATQTTRIPYMAARRQQNEVSELPETVDQRNPVLS